jgi:hypothetical protein
MNIDISIDIDASAEGVWRLVADDFTSIQTWSASVITSNPIDVSAIDGAPMGGRYCTFTDDPAGFGARETITEYDEDNLRLAFDVVPVNAPKALPLRENHVVVTLERLGTGQTRMRWLISPDLKPLGYVMYPIVKAALRKSFRGILEELKTYAERGASSAEGMSVGAAA